MKMTKKSFRKYMRNHKEQSVENFKNEFINFIHASNDKISPTSWHALNNYFGYVYNIKSVQDIINLENNLFTPLKNAVRKCESVHGSSIKTALEFTYDILFNGLPMGMMFEIKYNHICFIQHFFDYILLLRKSDNQREFQIARKHLNSCISNYLKEVGMFDNNLKPTKRFKLLLSTVPGLIPNMLESKARTKPDHKLSKILVSSFFSFFDYITSPKHIFLSLSKEGFVSYVMRCVLFDHLFTEKNEVSKPLLHMFKNLYKMSKKINLNNNTEKVA